MASLTADDVRGLRAEVRGEVILPDDAGYDEPARDFGAARVGALAGEGEAGVRASRSEEKNVVGVDHGCVGCLAVLLPDRPGVERLQRARASGHVGKAADPDETIRVVEISKLTENRHPEGLLTDDELAHEEVDQDVSLSWLECVLPELDDP